MLVSLILHEVKGHNANLRLYNIEKVENFDLGRGKILIGCLDSTSSRYSIVVAILLTCSGGG